MLDLALKLVGNGLHPAGCENRMEYLTSDPVGIGINQANGRAGVRDASIEVGLLVEPRTNFGDLLEVVWRVDVELVDSDSDDWACSKGVWSDIAPWVFKRNFVPYSSWSLSISNNI